MEASTVSSSTRRRWFSWATFRAVNWPSLVTSAASRSCAWGGGGCGSTPLAAAKRAMRPASIRSVFSRKPIASANRRTCRGLTTAAATPCAHSSRKALRS